MTKIPRSGVGSQKSVEGQYPFGKKAIGMICGGTGITPMIQALHALLGTVGDNTTVSMLYGSKVRRPY